MLVTSSGYVVQTSLELIVFLHTGLDYICPLCLDPCHIFKLAVYELLLKHCRAKSSVVGDPKWRHKLKPYPCHLLA